MIYDAQEFARVRNPMLLITAIAWALLLVEPDGMGMLAHCSPQSSGAMPSSPSLQMLLAMNPPASLAGGWAMMLVAMMSPVLISSLRYIRLRSFAHRRARSMVLFVVAYAAVWMAVGSVLSAIAVAVNLFAPHSYLPAAGVVLVAFVWQCSPFKQRCLNRCHVHTELAAFGFAADLAVLRFGMKQGIWCAGSCWALMLFPMLLPRGHIFAMAAVAFLIFSERLEDPRPLGWRLRGPGKAIRIAIAQTRIRLHASLASFI